MMNREGEVERERRWSHDTGELNGLSSNGRKFRARLPYNSVEENRKFHNHILRTQEHEISFTKKERSSSIVGIPKRANMRSRSDSCPK